MDNILGGFNNRYDSDFQDEYIRQKRQLEDYERVITEFLDEVKNTEMPTKFMLYWQDKFYDSMNLPM
jgi:ABC-type phosphate transport system auxiliary subunit